MQRRHAALLGLAVLLAITAGCLGGPEEPTTDVNESDIPERNDTIEPPPDANASDYPASVELYDNGTQVATIYAETSTTFSERGTGLSDHESLAEWQGMLFVYDQPGDRTYVMREMSFGIDIVYLDENGCVTDSWAAPEPGPNENGEDHEYPGHGQYVLEVPIGVATDNGISSADGIDAGDRVRIERGDAVVDGCCGCAASQG